MHDSRPQLLCVALVALASIFLWPESMTARQDAIPVNPPRVSERKNPPEPDASTRALLAEQNQKAIRKKAEKLLELATQLKAEVEKAESTAALSLPLIKRAEEIEKLAKQIKGQAKSLTP